MSSLLAELMAIALKKSAEAVQAYAERKYHADKRARETAEETQRRHAQEDAEWRARGGK